MKKLLLLLILCMSLCSSAFAIYQYSPGGTTVTDDGTYVTPNFALDVTINGTLRATTINASDVLTGTLPNDRLDSNQDVTKIETGVINSTEFEYLNGVNNNLQAQLDARVTIGSDQTITGNKTFGDGVTVNFEVGNGGITVNAVIHNVILTSFPSNPRAGDEYWVTANGAAKKYGYDGTTSNAMW